MVRAHAHIPAHSCIGVELALLDLLLQALPPASGLLLGLLRGLRGGVSARSGRSVFKRQRASTGGKDAHTHAALRGAAAHAQTATRSQTDTSLAMSPASHLLAASMTLPPSPHK